MKYYQAKIVYELINEAAALDMSQPEFVANEMRQHINANHPQQEGIYVIALNSKNKKIAQHCITLGTVNSSLSHPREIFKPLILSGATSFIMVHNHPSGDVSPSNADVSMTRKIREASQVMGFNFIDHLIIGDSKEDPHGRGYYSFFNAGLI